MNKKTSTRVLWLVAFLGAGGALAAVLTDPGEALFSSVMDDY
jgi:hypothetical protein